jgi:hypothetical protein
MWSYYRIKYKVLISIIKIFAGALRATRMSYPRLWSRSDTGGLLRSQRLHHVNAGSTRCWQRGRGYRGCKQYASRRDHR